MGGHRRPQSLAVSPALSSGRVPCPATLCLPGDNKRVSSALAGVLKVIWDPLAFPVLQPEMRFGSARLTLNPIICFLNIPTRVPEEAGGFLQTLSNQKQFISTERSNLSCEEEKEKQSPLTLRAARGAAYTDEA